MSGWDSLSWEAKRGAVLSQALFVCEMCNDAPATEVDHIWPKAQGGLDFRWNLRAACRPCNASKGDKVHAEDLRQTPMLILQGVRFHRDAAVTAVHQAAHWQALLDLVDSGLDVSDADERAGASTSRSPSAYVAVREVIDARVRSIVEAMFPAEVPS